MGSAEHKPKEETKPLYDVKILNIFIESVSEIFTAHLDANPKFGTPAIKPNRKAMGLITGIISFRGADFQGSVAASFNDIFLSAIGRKMLANFDASEASMADLAGELCNQIGGNVRGRLAGIGLKVTIGLPEIKRGLGYEINHNSSNPVIFLPVMHEGKKATLEFCLSKALEIPVAEVKPEEAHLEAGTAILL